MKIFANIVPIIKLLTTLRPEKRLIKSIQAARRIGDTELERKLILQATSAWGPSVMDSLGAKVHVIGEENIPDNGPVVMIANHQGYADIFTLYAVFKKYQFGFIAKEELAKLPVFGKMIVYVRSVFIKRNDPRGALKAINEGIEYIKQGFSLTIFPEGTRSQGPVPREFQRGSLKLATKPGVPIVPISIHGTYKMMEKDGYFHGADVYVKIHEPIETANMSRQEIKELTDRLQNIIFTGLDELIHEAGDDKIITK